MKKLRLLILNTIDAVLQEFGYSMVPFTAARIVAVEDKCTYKLDLTFPIGQRIRMGTNALLEGRDLAEWLNQ